MNIREKTCCFTGHRDIPRAVYSSLSRELDAVVRALIGKGVRFFGAGGALGFDTLAAETVLRLRQIYPQIRLILVLPCRDQTQGWRQEDVARYEGIKEQADQGGVYQRALYARMYAPPQPPSGGTQLRLRGLLYPFLRRQRLYCRVRPAAWPASLFVRWSIGTGRAFLPLTWRGRLCTAPACCAIIHVHRGRSYVDCICVWFRAVRRTHVNSGQVRHSGDGLHWWPRPSEPLWCWLSPG